MRKKIRRPHLMLVIAAAFIPMMFNACGGPNGMIGLVTSSSSSSSAAAVLQKKACQDALIMDYGTTYHPLMKNNCNFCHSNAHGSNDVRLSFNAFQSKGQSLIDFQATKPHGGNSINLTTQIAAVQKPWSDALAKYESCLAANPEEEAGSGVPFNVREKNLTGITATFREFSWDLFVESSDRAGQVRATYRIEARLYSFQGTVVGFEFRNPSLQLAASQSPVKLEGIRFTVAGNLQDAVTTYSRISAEVGDLTKTMLAPGFGNALVYVEGVPGGASATVPVGFQFINLN